MHHSFEQEFSSSAERVEVSATDERRETREDRDLSLKEWKHIREKILLIGKKRHEISVYGMDFRMFGHGFWTETSQELTLRYHIPPCGGLLARQFDKQFFSQGKDVTTATDEELMACWKDFLKEAIALLEPRRKEELSFNQGPIVSQQLHAYNGQHKPYGIEQIPRIEAKRSRTRGQKEKLLARVLQDLPTRAELFRWVANESRELVDLTEAYKRKNEEKPIVEDVEVHYPEGEQVFTEALGEDWKQKLLSLIPNVFRGIPRRIGVHKCAQTRGKEEDVNATHATLGQWTSVYGTSSFSQRNLGPENARMRLFAGRLKPSKFVEVFFHELGHGIDRNPDENAAQFEAKRIFAEEIADEIPVYSTYVRDSYREGWRKGLSEDFADSFARYFTDTVRMRFLQPKRYATIDRILCDVYGVTGPEVLRIREAAAATSLWGRESGYSVEGAEVQRRLREMPIGKVEKTLLITLPSFQHRPLPYLFFQKDTTPNGMDHRRTYQTDEFGKLKTVSMKKEGTSPLFTDPVYDDAGRLVEFTSWEKRFSFVYRGDGKLPSEGVFWDVENESRYSTKHPVPDGLIWYREQEDGLISEYIQTGWTNLDTQTNYRFHPDGRAKSIHYFLFNDLILRERFRWPDEVGEEEAQKTGLYYELETGEQNSRIIRRRERFDVSFARPA